MLPVLHCVIVLSQHGSVNKQNATMDKIVLVMHGNRDFDPISSQNCDF